MLWNRAELGGEEIRACCRDEVAKVLKPSDVVEMVYESGAFYENQSCESRFEPFATAAAV